jgi:hypothetical protein
MTAHGGRQIRLRAEAGGALCYVGLVRLDSIAVHGFSNRLARRIFSTGGRHRFPGVMDRLARWSRAAPPAYMAVVRDFIGAYSQRGLVMSSPIFWTTGCERALQYLADFGHELMLLQIWAEEDRTPPWTGELELRDAETGAALKLDFDDEARGDTPAPSTSIAPVSRPWRCAAAGATPASPLRNRSRACFSGVDRARGGVA